MKMSLRALLTAALTLAMLVGCGGGGSESFQDANLPGGSAPPPEGPLVGAPAAGALYYGDRIYLQSEVTGNVVGTSADAVLAVSRQEAAAWTLVNPTNQTSTAPVMFNDEVMLYSPARKQYLSASDGDRSPLTTADNTPAKLPYERFKIVDVGQPASTAPLTANAVAYLVSPAYSTLLSAGYTERVWVPFHMRNFRHEQVQMASSQSEWELWRMVPMKTYRTTWMAEMESELRDVPLTKAAIPGSHDAGTYSIADDAPFSPDLPLEGDLVALKNLLLENPTLAPKVNYYVARFARAQSSDITEQLKTGIRYFDLRPGASANGAGTDLLVVHSLYGGDILKMIDQVKSFMDKHPKEIVFLDFSHFTAMNASHHAKLITHIKNTFGTKLAPRPQGATGDDPKANSYTFGNLWDKGWQVVAMYHDDAANSETLLWRDGTDQSGTKWWPQKPTTDGVKVFLDNVLQVERPKIAAGELFVLQTVLTGDATLFGKAIIKLEAAAKAQATLNQVRGTLGGLESAVTSALNSVDSLQGQIDSKQSSINDHWHYIDTHSCYWHAVECAYHRLAIEVEEGEKSGLKKLKSTADSTLSSARNALDSANARIADLQQQIDEFLAGPTSLVQMAAEGNPTMVGWLEGWRDKGLNIIIQDVGDVMFVDAAMALNRKN